MANSSIFISAGDPSGDLAASRLAASLKELTPTCDLFGLGGEKLAGLGQHQLADPEDLAVLGFWEVARHVMFFRRLLADCTAQIARVRPRAVILVDYPGFNLRLAKRVKNLGIPIIYYISPQIWAWGRGRLNSIRTLVDLMLVILPFEKDFYSGSGLNTEFVGHYLLDVIPQEYITSTAPSEKPTTLAVLPGSRVQEIERMLPSMLQAARLFNRKVGAKAIVAAIKGRFDYSSFVEEYEGDSVSLSFDDSRRTIFESNLVLTASGTATLETAIIGRPMVVVYKTGFLTYQIARRLVRLESIALANLVLNEKAVPELIQHRATPEKMADALTRFVDDGQYCKDVTEKLARVPSLLGGGGASRRAAKMIADHVGLRGL